MGPHQHHKILFGSMSFIALFSGILMIFTKNRSTGALPHHHFFAIAGHYICSMHNSLRWCTSLCMPAHHGLVPLVIMMLNLNRKQTHKSNWVKIAAVIAVEYMVLCRCFKRRRQLAVQKV